MKRLIAVCLALALVLTCAPVMPAQANAETYGVYTYEIADGEATITECNTSISGMVTLPDTLGGCPVTAIGDWAFYDCDALVGVNLPDSITSIGEGAFASCNALTGIFAGADNPCFGTDACGVLYSKDYTALFIAPGALRGSYTIPEGVIYIGNDAFAGCENLEHLSVPNTLTSTGYELFNDCVNLQYNTYGNAKYLGNSINPCVLLVGVESRDIVDADIHPDTRVIYDEAFADCTNLTSIAIPSNVITIGQAVFAWCEGLTTIAIPDSVVSIGHGAFFGCVSLESITIPASVTSIGEGVCYNCHNFTTVFYQGTEEQKAAIQIGDDNDILLNANWFCSGTAIGDAFGEDMAWVLEGGVLTITGTGEMENFDWSSMPWSDYRESITSVVIEEGITSIGDHAFADCVNMRSITLPDSLISIGEYAFAYCQRLSVVLLPESVTYIGEYAFNYCNSLTGIYINENNANYTSDEQGVLYNKDKTVLIVAPGGISGVYFIPAGVTEIYNEAFYNCDSLAGIVIPEGVTIIGAYAFAYSDNFAEVTIPSSVTIIGSSAFMNCTGLSAIWVDEGNADYSSDDRGVLFNKAKTKLITAPGALYGSYSIPVGVTSVETEAFSNCCYLTEVIIPESVTTIGYYAFEYCDSLESIVIPDSVTELQACTFMSCTSLRSVQLSVNITQIKECTFSDCYSLTEITIPDGVTTIGPSAFSWCEGLTTVTIPDTVTEIKDDAFLFCNRLTDVYYGGTEEQWYAIDVGVDNEALANANIHLEGSGTVIPGTEPTEPEPSIPETEATEPEETVITGTCGENLSWTLESGVLTITGTGAMYDFSEGDTPWSEYADQIVFAVVHPGVTTIGNFAFSGCTRLELAAISEGVETIGVFAFANCTNLMRVLLPTSVNSIFYAAFSNCICLEEIYYAGTADQWSEIIFAGENTFLNRDNLCTSSIFVDPAEYPESEHDYAPETEDYQTFTYPGAIGLGLIFSPKTETEAHYDHISLYDSNNDRFGYYSGTEAAGQIAATPGDTVTVLLTSDGSVQRYGYSFVVILVQMFEEVNGVCGEGLTWKLDSAGTLTISGTGSMFNYHGWDQPWDAYRNIIKQVVVEDGVTSIGNYAFNYYNSLTSVTIADSVVSIGEYAFSDCRNLTEVALGNGLSVIRDYAFGWTGLISVSIPASVAEIGWDAFHDCTALTGIWVDEDNIYYTNDDYGILFNKNQTTLIKAPSALSGAYQVPAGVTCISGNAFFGCTELTDVTFPESLTDIDSNAFAYCEKLTCVNISQNVTYIGWGAFEGCRSLTGIWVDEDNMVYTSDDHGVLFNKDQSTLIKAPGMLSGVYEIPVGVTYITSEAFKYCDNLIGVTIPEGITEITANAFYGCENLLSISIPDGVTDIYEYAFADCVNLTGVELPDSVTYIGNYAFAWCHALTEIALPDGLTIIHYNVFTQCYGLTDVTIPVSVTYVENGAFAGCENLTNVYYKGIEEELANLFMEGDNEYLSAATWHCIGVVECEYLETGSETPVRYKTLEAALEAATSGTITLLADVSADTVILRPGITLDLGGYVLTANLVVGMKNSVILDGGNACTGGGLLQVAQDNFIYARDTQQQIIPVWNGVDGYLFTKVTFQQMARTAGNGAAQYIFLPTLSNKAASALLADGGLDNALNFKVSLTWSDGQCQQFYTYSDEFVKQVFDGTGRWVFSLTVTGISSIDDMVASAVVVTDSGAQATVNGTALIPG